MYNARFFRSMEVERVLCFPRNCSGRDSCVAPEFRPVSHFLLPLPWTENAEKSFYTSPIGLWKQELQKYSVGTSADQGKHKVWCKSSGYICLDVATLEDVVRPNSKCLVILLSQSGRLLSISKQGRELVMDATNRFRLRTSCW